MDFPDLLSRASSASPADLVAVLAVAGQAMGVRSLRLYLLDFGQSELEAVAAATESSSTPPRIDVRASAAGRALWTRQVVGGTDSEGRRVLWVPVVERADALGVLAVEPVADIPAERLIALGQTAGALVRLASQYTDLFDEHRHRADMNLAAEMQWELLPSLAFASPGIRIQGVLEPAYEIGGDAFDYSVNRGIAQAAIFDAMGHGLEATQTVSLALGAYRYCRRKRLALSDTATTIDVAVRHIHGGDSFVTGQLFEVDLVGRHVRWIDAGHPDPLHLRGHRVVAEPHTEPWVPFGLAGPVGRVGEFTLEAGDRILLFSDGAPEARPDGGREYGRPRLVDAVQQELAHDPSDGELLQSLIRGVQSHRLGALEDDVTFVLITLDD